MVRLLMSGMAEGGMCVIKDLSVVIVPTCFHFSCRKIVAEYEKTIAQMIGGCPAWPGLGLPRGRSAVGRVVKAETATPFRMGSFRKGPKHFRTWLCP